jgi:hypothetical protein
MTSKSLNWGIVAIGIVALSFTSLVVMNAGQPASGAPVAIDNDDIGGVVTGPQGPEAGVWVIAETRTLPTRLIKSVVTDDQGRYVVPDLPAATYDVWVRGYGLVDSPKVKATPGKIVNLKAVATRDKRAAAEHYPALYWFSLLQVPPKTDFPGTGTGEKGNGIATNIRSQGEWIRQVVNTDGCTGCHQLGGKATREIPETILGKSGDTKAAWDRRIQAGQAGGGMSARFTQVGRQRALAMYADWTDRIAAGELPSVEPSRPQGRERNVVITMWDWADPKVYMHDEIASDKRNPTVNAARGAVALLGRGSDLEQPDDRAQLGHGKAGSRVGGGANPQTRDAVVVSGGVGSSVGQAVPDHSRPTRAGAVRSENQTDDDNRYLFHVGPREF